MGDTTHSGPNAARIYAARELLDVADVLPSEGARNDCAEFLEEEASELEGCIEHGVFGRRMPDIEEQTALRLRINTLRAGAAYLRLKP